MFFILALFISIAFWYVVYKFINRKGVWQGKYDINTVQSSQQREIYNQDSKIVKGNSAFGGDKYVLDFANEKYNQDNEPAKRGDPLEFRSYCVDSKKITGNDIVELIGETITFGPLKSLNPEYRIYEAIKDNNKGD